MRFSRIFAINSLMLMGCGLLMLVPALVDAIAQHRWINPFSSGALITLIAGLIVFGLSSKEQIPLRPKEMFLTTTLMWLLFTTFSAIPFYLPPHNLTLVDAFFESMSGLTGTGATILTNLEEETAGTLLWRSMMQWLGGVGIIVVALIVLPTLQIGGMQLFATESSALSERINPTMRQSIRDILVYFVLLSILCAFCLWLAGMTPFDAINHAMTTLSTGGFSTHDAGIMYFQKPGIIWILTVFMILGGLPLVLGPHLFYKRWDMIRNNVQIATFIKILCLIILLLIPVVGFDKLQHIIFQTVSVLTTTGFVSTTYGTWGAFATTLFLFITAFGACTGSTSGGIKMFRFAIIGRILSTKMKRLIKPYAVFVPRYGQQIIDADIASGVLFFLSLFLITFMVATLSLAALGLDYLTAFSGVLSCLANVGPALGNIIGPDHTYADLPDTAKWILSFVMLAGRLEFTSIVVLFLPFLWRKNT
ncbi:MAG: TrkH family potassium uptake protein [Alphaproteobacteria bacterium]|nr:TrkH family potassium uptake protein [Alphaproteobacteria bacterium]